jgi:hypothetical protein
LDPAHLEDLQQFVSNAVGHYGSLTEEVKKDMMQKFRLESDDKVQDVINWLTQVSAKIEWLK